MWDHEGARYELEDRRGQRLKVTPQRGAMLVYDRHGTRATFAVLYDGLAPFDWPSPGAGGD
ncbi:MAG TPA: hypothetical protein VFS43_13385 [Polyangiaceae bacterium]|nr:hypothetical protein [Polyangiaceae bacterium]